ncbi:hypothetical protein [Lacrimispora brassicae]
MRQKDKRITRYLFVAVIICLSMAIPNDIFAEEISGRKSVSDVNAAIC